MPSGDYLLLAVARIAGEPLMGEIMEVQVPVPLKERLKTMKDLPLPQQDMEELAEEGELGGRKLKFLCSMSPFPTINDKGKSKTKCNYFLQTSLMEVNGKSLKQVQPEKGTKLNVFIMDMTGKAVLKKKDKWEANMPQIQGDLPYGCYLVVAWTEFKGQKLGKCFHTSLGKTY
ncbi:MAG: hypothetical protein WAX69_24085 [Victivallales bacterium]